MTSRIRWRVPITGYDTVLGWLTRAKVKRFNHRSLRMPIYDGGRGPWRVKKVPFFSGFRSDPVNLGGWNIPHRRRTFFRRRRDMPRVYNLLDADDQAAMVDEFATSECQYKNEPTLISVDWHRRRVMRRIRDTMSGLKPEAPYRGWLFELLTDGATTETNRDA